MSKKIIYKSPEQIDNIREAGKYLTELLHLSRDMAKPGVTGTELEQHAQSFLDKNHVTGAFKGYGGFPANLCVSVNDCVVHGIPDKTPFKDGDLVKVDLGVTYNACIADAAISFVVGGPEKNIKGQGLIDATKGALDAGLEMIEPGVSMFGYGKAVYTYLQNKNYAVIKNLTGHGVGVDVHEGPPIFNWPNGEIQRYTFQPGMVIALEPITAIKSTTYKEKPGNHWNLYTKKGDLGAQWEYTLAITESGYEILAGII